MNKKAFHEIVAEKLIAQLILGTAPWQRPWQPGEPGAFSPMNPTTGKRYRGINAIQLMSEGYSDQRWLTYKQAAGVGGQVNKGEKGTPIQYWKFKEEQAITDVNGKPRINNEGEKLTISIKLERPRVFFATVFNAEQIEAMPPLQARKEPEWSALERAEHMLQASGAVIKHSEHDKAFYRPATDSIHLPDKNQFESADRYYATALHELGHWSGASQRLARDLAHPFGSEGYSKEELRAEIFSMLMGDELGIGHDPGQHAAYVSSWVSVLKDDPLEIFRAASDAEKIQDYVLGLEQKYLQDHALAQGQDQSVVVPTNQETTMKFPSKSTEEDDINAQVEQAMFIKESTLTVDVKTMPPLPVLDGYPDLAEIIASSIDSAKDTNSTLKTFIQVPFKDKDVAKELGAKWDRQAQSWYVPDGVAIVPFDQWKQETIPTTDNAPDTATVQTQENNPVTILEREYLAVPYSERAAAKAAGAAWDKVAKSWYVGSDALRNKVERWKPDNIAHQQGPAMRPEEEFTEALRSLGCVVSGEHPIMDGAKQRITIDGDKKHEHSGFYVGHLDGHPAGYIKNNRSGVEMIWKSKGYALDPEEKAQLQAAVAANKSRDREMTLQAKQKAVASEIVTLLSVSEAAPADHPYLISKRVRSGDLLVVPPATTVLPEHSSILIGKDWKESASLRDAHPDKLVFTEGDLLVPAYDANGTIWTAQTIQGSGRKIFVKDSVKQANFHIVGATGHGLDALGDAPAIVISEGYATADSLSNVLGYPTISAFDSGNLELVAKAVHMKYPDKPIVIAGDDDKHLETTQGYNPGRTKASEAAKAVCGKVLFPIFAPGEQSSDPKKFSDFNDLATKSSLGAEGIKRQVCTAVDAVIEKHLANSRQQKPILQRVRVAERNR